MTELDAQTVLATIPGWEDAEVSEMTGGQTNRTWLVTSPRGKAVLKIDEQSREPPYNPRPDEEIIQRRAAEQGLANDVLHSSETVYLTRFVEGDVWSREHLLDDDNLVRLAGLLKNVHSLPLTGRHFNPERAADLYLARVPRNFAEPARLCADIVRQLLAPKKSVLLPQRPRGRRNIIATPALRLLDWEYACDNDPLFDLATVIAHHKLPEHSANLLLDTYFDGDAARWHSQLDQQMRLYCALLWLWSASRPDADEERLHAILDRLG